MSDSVPASQEASLPRYQAMIEKVFFNRYVEGASEIPFTKDELIATAPELGIILPSNVPDVIYSVRYRTPMPGSILSTQPDGMEWIIEGRGKSSYVFRLVKMNRIVPRKELITIKVPDATPEIIASYALNDEQALLAIVRYNRLIDIFLGLTTYSLQSHLRTTLNSGSQIEIDEVYVGLDRYGAHYVIPVQAKGGNDQISVVQTRQDLQCCSEKFPGIAIRAISAQFMEDDLVAMFLLTVEEDEVKVVDEKHYRLVAGDQLDPEAIRTYR